MTPKHRPPTSPGEMLLEEFLVPMEMTQRALAKELGLSVQSVNLIIKGKRGITAETAVRLSRVFKNSPQFRHLLLAYSAVPWNPLTCPALWSLCGH